MNKKTIEELQPVAALLSVISICMAVVFAFACLRSNSSIYADIFFWIFFIIFFVSWSFQILTKEK